MVKIICTATSFGYGPVSKLLTICKELAKKGYQLEIIGAGVALELASHTNVFDKIWKIDFSNPDIKKSCLDEVLKKADLFLNVLEPKAVSLAKNYDIPITYVDSLFWMWDKMDISLKDVDKYIAQKFPGVQDNIKKFKWDTEGSSNNFYVCNPIVNTKHMNMSAKKDNLLLVNFSGIETPFNDINQDCYSNKVMDNLIEHLNNSSYERILVTGNNKIMNEFNMMYKKVFRGEFKHLAHDDFYKF